MRRRIIREKVIQALYAKEIGGEPIEFVIDHILKDLRKNKDAHEFAKNLVIQTLYHTTEIDKVIKGRVTNWDFKRIAVLDRLILRMAICELLFFKEIPPKVSMNEAIELAKLFSTEKSGQFVNGVLDAVLENLKSAGELSKAGRGLKEGAPAPRLKRANVNKTL